MIRRFFRLWILIFSSMPLASTGCSMGKAKSSSCPLISPIPSRYASGAKMSKVSWAKRNCFSGGKCPMVNILCRRSMILIMTTRMSLPIAKNIFLSVSVWRVSSGIFSVWIGPKPNQVFLRRTRDSFVTPSTISATSLPNRLEISLGVVGVSSIVSWRSEAIIISPE